MSSPSYSYVFLGLTITSSWGNGHATTYRALVRELCRRGHRVLFLERDLPFYRANRDLTNPPYGTTELYDSIDELRDRFAPAVRDADLVIVGSYVPQGTLVGAWVTSVARGGTAFYDIDTPVTLQKLENGDGEYLTPELVARYDLYLSFTGGPTLRTLEQKYRAACARPLYCSADPDLHYPTRASMKWDLGYLGTYSDDRQRKLDELLIRTARLCKERRFVVAGPQYPASIEWPDNVLRIDHLAPLSHRDFYSAQRYTLNVTREQMTLAGYSPSVRLFEAAACATPVISDPWPGLESFFAPGREILLASSTVDALRHMTELSEADRVAMGARARARVLQEHTAAHRTEDLEAYTRQLLEKGARSRRKWSGSAESTT